MSAKNYLFVSLIIRNKGSKRVSISSSNSSILQQTPTSILNFDIVDDELSHLEKTVKGKHFDNSTNASENNLNQNGDNLDQSKKNCPSQSDSINNSISNIYIKAFTEKRAANRKKPGAGGASGFNHSISNVISINTNPNQYPSYWAQTCPNGGNKYAPNNLDTESVKTFESEKSCY